MEEVPDILNYLIIAILLLFSALFSGLTLGLMSLSAHELKRKAELGDKDAEKVYKVRKKGNLLLTTLLVGNVAVNSILSVFLGSITSGVVAAAVATALIVIFGEIIPQAVFSRFALKLGAKVVPLVRIFIWIFYPVTFPIAWILDKALGEELPTIYSKQELVKLIEEHEDLGDGVIDEDEEKILRGALTFSDKKVADVMTPRTVVEQFEISQRIDEGFIQKVKNSSFSRFPVYKDDKDNVVGIFLANSLLGLSGKEGKRLSDLELKKPEFIQETETLDNALQKFIETKKHLFIVKDEFGSVVGVLSLEDIIEEILETEIMDEKDKYKDLREFAKSKV